MCSVDLWSDVSAALVFVTSLLGRTLGTNVIAQQNCCHICCCACNLTISVLVFLLFFDIQEKCEFCNDQTAGQVSICGKSLNVAIFSDTINMINVKLCMMVVLIEHYPFI